MNKNAKAAIAVAAGALLLLGGGGTLAVWNTSKTVDAGSVGTGTLNLDTTGLDGVWYHYDPTITHLADYATDGDVVDPATYHVVPEDKLIYIADGIELTAEGGDLYFTFGANAGGATASGFTIGDVSAVETTAGGAVLPTPTTTISAEQFSAPANISGVPVYHVSGTALDATVTVSFTLEFDADNTDDQASTIDLSDAEITVNQVIPA